MTIARDVLIRVAVQRQGGAGGASNQADAARQAAAAMSSYSTTINTAIQANRYLSVTINEATRSTDGQNEASEDASATLGKMAEAALRTFRGIALLSGAQSENIGITVRLAASAQGAVDVFKGLEKSIDTLEKNMPELTDVTRNYLTGLAAGISVIVAMTSVIGDMASAQRDAEVEARGRRVDEERGKLEALQIELRFRQRIRDVQPDSSSQIARDQLELTSSLHHKIIEIQTLRELGIVDLVREANLRREIMALSESLVSVERDKTEQQRKALDLQIAAVQESGKALEMAQKEKKERESLAESVGRMKPWEQKEAEKLLEKQQAGTASRYELERLEKLLPEVRDLVGKAFASQANTGFVDKILAAQGKKSSTEIDAAVTGAQQGLGAQQGETPEQAVARRSKELKDASDAAMKLSEEIMAEHIKRTNEHEKELQALKTTLQLYKQQQI